MTMLVILAKYFVSYSVATFVQYLCDVDLVDLLWEEPVKLNFILIHRANNVSCYANLSLAVSSRGNMFDLTQTEHFKCHFAC